MNVYNKIENEQIVILNKSVRCTFAYKKPLRIISPYFLVLPSLR